MSEPVSQPDRLRGAQLRLSVGDEELPVAGPARLQWSAAGRRRLCRLLRRVRTSEPDGGDQDAVLG